MSAIDFYYHNNIETFYTFKLFTHQEVLVQAKRVQIPQAWGLKFKSSMCMEKMLLEGFPHIGPNYSLTLN